MNVPQRRHVVRIQPGRVVAGSSSQFAGLACEQPVTGGSTPTVGLVDAGGSGSTVRQASRSRAIKSASSVIGGVLSFDVPVVRHKRTFRDASCGPLWDIGNSYCLYK